MIYRLIDERGAPLLAEFINPGVPQARLFRTQTDRDKASRKRKSGLRSSMTFTELLSLAPLCKNLHEEQMSPMYSSISPAELLQTKGIPAKPWLFTVLQPLSRIGQLGTHDPPRPYPSFCSAVFLTQNPHQAFPWVSCSLSLLRHFRCYGDASCPCPSLPCACENYPES